MSQIKKLLSILGVFIICSCSQSGILSLNILKKNSIINIGFAGDTSFTHGTADDNPLKEISKITKKFDLMFLNLETVIARNDVGSTLEGKKYNFKSPIKNNPENNKICSLVNTPNAEEKCLELCNTRPDCKAYSLDKGALVQTYTTCNLYNDVSIDKINSNAYTGKPIKKTNADYYIKK